MKIDIKSIPHTEQRYETLGDYWTDYDGTVLVRVSDTGDWRMNLLIAVHEVIELSLCEARGISEPDIMAFDLAHPESMEPGAEPDAPYAKEHAFSENIERLLCAEFGIRWQDYEAVCERIAG